MRTVALIVANDPGAGFPRSKYLEPLRGTPMIEQVIAEAASWPVDEVIVVLGPGADEIIANADLGEATLVIDPEWSEGIAASLRVAIDLLQRDQSADRIVVGLADQPGIDANIIEALLNESAGHRVVVPKYRYRRGWPMVLSSDLWDLLIGLEGPADLHDVLESHAEVAEVWFDGLEPARMLTPSDLPPTRAGD